MSCSQRQFFRENGHIASTPSTSSPCHIVMFCLNNKTTTTETRVHFNDVNCLVLRPVLLSVALCVWGGGGGGGGAFLFQIDISMEFCRETVLTVGLTDKKDPPGDAMLYGVITGHPRHMLYYTCSVHRPLSICLSACLPVCLSVCLSASL